jgi:hypothetical protein
VLPADLPIDSLQANSGDFHFYRLSGAIFTPAFPSKTVRSIALWHFGEAPRGQFDASALLLDPPLLRSKLKSLLEIAHFPAPPRSHRDEVINSQYVPWSGPKMGEYLQHLMSVVLFGWKHGH